MADVHVAYYTDPACPESWTLEPVLRRLAAELWRLAGEWRVRAERRLSGELWSLA